MFDVVVIGGGHAGTEACAAAARRGANTLLLTQSTATIGAMSCNPSIGGIGKGHIVREVDAFDGLMARAADAAGIHYRMLNRAKGSAVHGPRVQADRRRYAAAIQAMLAGQLMLTIRQGEAGVLIVKHGRVQGVSLTDGSIIHTRSVVLATGTFLGGRIFRGEERASGGRVDERPATALADQLRGEGLPIGRLKTGTPPRLDGRTIDWAKLAEQGSDLDPWTMSPLSGGRPLPQIACATTRTTRQTHDVIRHALDRSPLFSGAIDASGPRYCPSIEDKVHRFGDRDGHQVFLEPEGLDDPVVYPNGLSTSLPIDAQQAMISSIDGLQHARINIPGYAVEYDFIDPRALDATLELRAIGGIFCAGQINGTTGYEEAAGQGLLAGVNAAAGAIGAQPLVLDRASSYLGVMIDDLTLQGVSEPYRMLTARAEYRLALRADNAETRLGKIARQAKVVSDKRRVHQCRREEALANIDERLSQPITASALRSRGAMVAEDASSRSGKLWLRLAKIYPSHLLDAATPEERAVNLEAAEDARYAPYLDRQADEVARLRQGEQITLAADMMFEQVPGLSTEMVERLNWARPGTLAAASRIHGITPAALSALMLHARKRVA